jgi:tetratricopeptide (TPR) repeat protein
MMLRAIISFMIVVISLLFVETASAEAIAVRAGAHPGYGRIVFKWSLPVQYTAKIENGALNVSFGEPADTNYNEVTRNLKSYVSGARVSNGGRSVSFPLTGDYGVRSFYTGSFLVVDIVGDAAPKAQKEPDAQPTAKPAPTPKPAAQPVAQAASRPQSTSVPTSGPDVSVRKGEHPTYTRVVFDWTRKPKYQLGDYEGQVVVNFAEPARYKLSAVNQNPDPLVRGMHQNGNSVVIDVASGSRIKHFYAGTKLVVDVFQDQMAKKAAPAQGGSVPDKVVVEAPQKQAPAPAQVAQAKKNEEPPAPKAVPVAKVSEPKPIAEPKEKVESNPAPEKMSAPEIPAAFSMRFDFGEPVGAAAFRRAGAVWLVFDKQTEQDIDSLKNASGDGVKKIEQIDVPRATVLRIETSSGFNPRPKREGLSWIFEFAKLPIIALQEVNVEAQPHSPAGARLFMPVQEGGLAVPMQDPAVGDNLVVVPVIPLGHGVNTPRSYPQFNILASAQGLVYKLNSDDLRIRTLASGVEVTSASSLKLSDTGKKEVASAKMGGLRGVTRLFDFDKWKVGPFADFRENKREMEKSVAGLKGPRRELARLDLARFYLSHAMGPEALGVLQVMEQSDPDKSNDPEFKALRGVANFAMRRLDEAEKDFEDEAVLEKDEGAFWSAAIKSAKGDLQANAPDMKRLAGVIRPYPPRIKFPMATILTESALSIGDVRQAESYLEVLEAEGLNSSQTDEVKYLRGRTKEISGDRDGAVVVYEEVEQGDHRPSRAKAALAKAELLHKSEKISDKELIESLERLRFAWRGDDFEFNLLRRLGDMYVKTGNYRDGLRTLRQAATYFRTHPKAEEVTQQMIQIFEELYLQSKADSLPPVTAIALYDEFRELTPAGEKGDEMIRKLADRLAAVDLLREAAELLENQVQFRLSGLKKAQVGTRLALVYLASSNPERAIRALKKSSQSDMPEEQVVIRRHLEARALIDMGKEDEAIALLEKDESEDADLLRSEIYWAASDWRNAGLVLKRLALAKGARSNKPLDEAQARIILNLAVAYTLGANERGVASVRADYGTAMESTTLRDAFRLIAARENAGMLDPRTITQLVKPAENFTSFMTRYTERLKAGELSAIN